MKWNISSVDVLTMKVLEMDGQPVGLFEAFAAFPADIRLVSRVRADVTRQLNGLSKWGRAVLTAVHFTCKGKRNSSCWFPHVLLYIWYTHDTNKRAIPPSACFFLVWYERAAATEKLMSQCLQWKGFSPVCRRMWFFRDEVAANFAPHSSHAYGLSSKCSVRLWYKRPERYKHWTHKTALTKEWLVSKLPFVSKNVLLHFSHIYFILWRCSFFTFQHFIPVKFLGHYTNFDTMAKSNMPMKSLFI